jgi:hypothetical protein
MSTHLSYDVALTRIDDLQRKAHRHSVADAAQVAVRPATAADTTAIIRLAALDSAPVPAGTILIAEVAGEAHAAIGIESGAVVADPFRRTTAAVRVLRAHAAQARRRTRRARTPRYRRALARGAA